MQSASTRCAPLEIHRTALPQPLRPWALVLCSVLLLSPAAGAQLAEDEEWFDGPTSVQPGSDRTVPDVAVGGNGRTVVAWQVNTNGQDIYARVFEADGTPVDDPFLVNTTLTDEQADPRVAAGPDGTFTVVWVNTFDPVRGANEYSVRSRTFDPDGAALTTEQLVNEASKSPSFSGGALNGRRKVARHRLSGGDSGTAAAARGRSRGGKTGVAAQTARHD